jgi:hypothetical protein
MIRFAEAFVSIQRQRFLCSTFLAFGHTNLCIHIFVKINCFVCNKSGENAKNVTYFSFILYSIQPQYLLDVTQAGICLFIHCAKQRLYMRSLEINNFLTHKL